MGKPIFTQNQRNSWMIPELEVAKLKFKREIDNSLLGKLMRRVIKWLSGKLQR
jgi:hypothetical protein